MREILFRGKRLNDGEWVEGYYAKCQEPINHGIGYILPKVKSLEFGNIICIGGFIEVKPETVGQYTGLTDRNGKRIFEGDILETAIGVGYVVYGTACFSMHDIHSQNRPALDIVEDASGLEIEVIGNIFDNPELLE